MAKSKETSSTDRKVPPPPEPPPIILVRMGHVPPPYVPLTDRKKPQ